MTEIQANSLGGEEVPAWIPRLFRMASVVNFTLPVPSIVAPRKSAELFGSKPPDPPFPLQAWSGMAVMFGFMFQEIANDPIGNRGMVRYAWAEKLVSGVAMAVGYRKRDATLAAMLSIVAADWAMILPFMYAKKRLDEIAAATGEG